MSGCRVAGAVCVVPLLCAVACSSLSESERFLDAVITGKPDRVKTHVANGVDVEIVLAGDRTKKTPLVWACSMGKAYPKGDHQAVVETLLQAGADLSARDAFGNSAVVVAAAYGATDVLATLLEFGAEIDERGSEGNTPLISASRGGHLEAVQVLLEHGADVSMRNSSGESAADVAAANGHEEILQVLQRAGSAP